jgi:hypothetical protein
MGDDGGNSDNDEAGSEVEGWDHLLLEEEEDDTPMAGMDTDVN